MLLCFQTNLIQSKWFHESYKYCLLHLWHSWVRCTLTDNGQIARSPDFRMNRQEMLCTNDIQLRKYVGCGLQHILPYQIYLEFAWFCYSCLLFNKYFVCVHADLSASDATVFNVSFEICMHDVNGGILTIWQTGKICIRLAGVLPHMSGCCVEMKVHPSIKINYFGKYSNIEVWSLRPLHSAHCI